MNRPNSPALNRLVQAAQLVAAGAGAVWSFDFGVQISGLPLGVLLAANGAFFGAIMVRYVADLGLRLRETDSAQG